ncbi:unnamed protein product [Rhizophagus irregularis]|nr:unnamed protein product [Rhizophagus irregularis]
MFYYKHILNFQNSRKTNLLTFIAESLHVLMDLTNGIQKRQPIKRFHMKKSFVAQNSPLFHWKNSRQIQIKACDNEIYVELWLKEPGSRTREMKLIMIRLNL